MALWKDQYGREQNTPDPAPEKAVAPVAAVDTPRTAAPGGSSRCCPPPAKPKNRCWPPA